MEIFIGNLPYDITENDLRNVFQRYGEVASVNIPTDIFTGEVKGLAFVTIREKKKTPAAQLPPIKIKGKLVNIERIDINYITEILPDSSRNEKK
jgi:RNA recognition motif-containing protein